MRRRGLLPEPIARPEGLREFVQHSVGAVVMVCGLFALLGYMYFAGTADPQSRMRHFPVAVVDEDTPAEIHTPVGPQPLTLGRDVVGGLMDNNDWSKLDLHVVSAEGAESGLRDGRFYAVIRVPEGLSAGVAALMDGTAAPGDPAAVPQITVSSSPRVSIAGTSVAQRLADGMQGSVDRRMGPKILDSTRRLAEARGTPPVSATAAEALAHPVRVAVSTWNPLPAGMSNSTLPMFYALVVILAGFTGAMVISNLLDARLGFLPIEVGPLSVAVEVSEHGRLLVLFRKWLVTLVTAPLVSAIYLGIARALGVGGFSFTDAFWFSVLGIVAVGVCAHTVIAALGSLGLLVNLVVFVILGIPTSGGATPPEMLPGFFRVIGSLEPMHQAYVGFRSILFFESRGAAGLSHAVGALVAWAVVGVVAGVLVAVVYDRVGLHRQRVGERIHPDLRRSLRDGRAAGSGDRDR